MVALLEKIAARPTDPLGPYAYRLDHQGEAQPGRLAMSTRPGTSGAQEDPRLGIDESLCAAGFVISTSRRDRAGDVVLPAGCLGTLSDYEKNPVVFFAHKSEDPPVAFARDKAGNLALWIEGERILSRAYFHCQTEESERVFDLVAKRILACASIGFVPVEFELLPWSEEEFGPGEPILKDDLGGLLFRRWSLLEWSVVAVPANAGALRSWLDKSNLKSPILRKSLEAGADYARGQLFLDARAAAVTTAALPEGVAEPKNERPDLAPVDTAGRRQDGKEQPQAVLLSPRRFPTAEDAKQWLEENALSASGISAGEAPTDPFVAVQFAATECKPDTVRSEAVEDGVEVLFCQLKDKDTDSSPTTSITPDAPMSEPAKAADEAVIAPVPEIVTKEIIEPALLPKTEPEAGVASPKTKDHGEMPLPYGAQVLQCMCGHLCGLKDYLCTAMPQLEHPKVSKWVQKSLDACCRMYEEMHELAGTEYPQLFSKEKEVNTPAADPSATLPGLGKSLGLDREALHKKELGALLVELSSDKNLKPSQQLACAAFAEHITGWATYTSNVTVTEFPQGAKIIDTQEQKTVETVVTAPVVPSPASSPSPPVANTSVVDDTELQQRFDKLAKLYYELTGEEV